MKIKKLQSILMGFGVIILTLMDPLKASAQAYGLFPLTAQQIEFNEGDQFYATFVHNFPSYWHQMVFNSLLHKGSAKKITVSQYSEISVFDELQMKEVESWVFTYDDKNKCWKRKFLKENVQNRRSIVAWSWADRPSEASSCNGNFPVIGAETKNEIEYNVNYNNTKITYTRDPKQRVISATIKYNNNITNIIKFEYFSNSDYISSIKDYNGEGNLEYEVNYEYIYIEGNPYLKKASHKIPTRHPSGTTEYEYTEYSFLYGGNKAYDVVNVKRVWYNENETDYDRSTPQKREFKRRTDEFDVSIDRYNNGDFKTVCCQQYSEKMVRVAEVVWTFLEYDSHHNWTKMKVEDKMHKAFPKAQFTREIIYDQTMPPASTLNPSPKVDNIKGTSNIKNGNRFVVIDGSQLRLRLGPSTSSDTFKWPDGTNRHPNVGDKFRYLGEEGDFYKIDFNGNEVWVSKQYSHLE